MIKNITLFRDVQNILDKNKEDSRLGWVCDAGWSGQHVAMENNLKTVAPALEIISSMIKSAYEKDCQDFLKSLFDALADAVREQGRVV